MPIVQNSTKLSTQSNQYIICSESFVFFRVVLENDGFKFMTATASEDAGNFKAYDSQDRLIYSTIATLNDLDWEYLQKQDHTERRYIEARGLSAVADIETIAVRVLDTLDFKDIAVLARQEMRDIYDEFSINDSGEDVYLSDGMSISKNGDLTSS